MDINASGSRNLGSSRNIYILRTKGSQISRFSSGSNLGSFLQREHFPINVEVKLRACDGKPLKKRIIHKMYMSLNTCLLVFLHVDVILSLWIAKVVHVIFCGHGR